MSEPCTMCPATAKWVICDLRDGVWVYAWYSCGRHVHRVLSEFGWETDTVQIMDMGGEDSF